MPRVPLLAIACAAGLAGCGRDGPFGPPDGGPMPDAGYIETRPGFSGGLDPIGARVPGGPSPLHFGDCNGDGRVDAIRLPKNQPIRVYAHGEDGTFTEVPVPQDELRQVTGEAAALSDLDGDGDQDLVVGSADTTLLLGDGNCGFTFLRTLEAQVTGIVAQLHLVDVDEDGVDDVLAASGGPRPLRLWLGGDPLEFKEWAISLGRDTPTGLPMFGVVPRDFDGDGHLDLLVMVDTGGSTVLRGVPGPRPSFQPDAAATALVAPPNPMSTSYIDHDRDGTPSLFVSGNLFLQARGTTFVDTAAEARVIADFEPLPWSSLTADLDLDGWPDLLVGRSIGHTQGTSGLLYRNAADGTLVADPQPADPGPTVRLACAFLAGDARPFCQGTDPALPGQERWYALTVPQSGGFVGLRLEGTLSGRWAGGARVRRIGTGKPEVRDWRGDFPTYGLHDPLLVFATGDATASTFQVEWPSGLTTTHTDLASGRTHVLVEPEVLTLDRRRTTTGGDPIRIEATPARAGATTLEVTLQGPGRLETLGNTDGTRTWLWHPPDVPGEARLLLALDGRTLHTRPRLVAALR